MSAAENSAQPSPPPPVEPDSADSAMLPGSSENGQDESSSTHVPIKRSPSWSPERPSREFTSNNAVASDRPMGTKEEGGGEDLRDGALSQHGQQYQRDLTGQRHGGPGGNDDSAMHGRGGPRHSDSGPDSSRHHYHNNAHYHHQHRPHSPPRYHHGSDRPSGGYQAMPPQASGGGAGGGRRRQSASPPRQHQPPPQQQPWRSNDHRMYSQRRPNESYSSRINAAPYAHNSGANLGPSHIRRRPASPPPIRRYDGAVDYRRRVDPPPAAPYMPSSTLKSSGEYSYQDGRMGHEEYRRGSEDYRYRGGRDGGPGAGSTSYYPSSREIGREPPVRRYSDDHMPIGGEDGRRVGGGHQVDGKYVPLPYRPAVNRDILSTRLEADASIRDSGSWAAPPYQHHHTPLGDGGTHHPMPYITLRGRERIPQPPSDAELEGQQQIVRKPTRISPVLYDDIMKPFVEIGDAGEGLANQVIHLANHFSSSIFIAGQMEGMSASTISNTYRLVDVRVSKPLPVANAAEIANAVVECVTHLPLKSSFYAAFVALWNNGMTQLPEGVKEEHLTALGEKLSAAKKAGLDGIKMDEDAEDRPITAEDEKILQAKLKRDIFGYFGGAIVDRCASQIECFVREGNLQEVKNLLRFVIDLVNVGVVDAVSLFGFLSNLLELSDRLTAVGYNDVFLGLVMSVLPWVAREVCEAHEVIFSELFQRIEKFMESRNANESLLACKGVMSPIRPNPTTAVVPSDALDVAWEAVKNMKAGSWSSKALFRLYRSPQMADRIEPRAADSPSPSPVHQLPSLPTSESTANEIVSAMRRRVEAKMAVVLRAEGEAALLVGTSDSSASGIISQDVVADVGVGGGTVGVNGCFRPRSRLVIWDNKELKELLPQLKPLETHDRWVLEEELSSVLHSFRHTVELCARTLLRIPLVHDQFEVVLVEVIFNEMLRLPHSLEPHLFYFRLLSLIVEKQNSTRAIVESALRCLIKRIVYWDNSTLECLSEFFAYWLSVECVGDVSQTPNEVVLPLTFGFDYWSPTEILLANKVTFYGWTLPTDPVDGSGEATAIPVENAEDEIRLQRLPEPFKIFLCRSMERLSRLLPPLTLVPRLPVWLHPYVPSSSGRVVCPFAAAYQRETASNGVDDTLAMPVDENGDLDASFELPVEYSFLRKVLRFAFDSTEQKTEAARLLGAYLLIDMLGRPRLAQLPSISFIENMAKPNTVKAAANESEVDKMGGGDERPSKRIKGSDSSPAQVVAKPEAIGEGGHPDTLELDLSSNQLGESSDGAANSGDAPVLKVEGLEDDSMRDDETSDHRPSDRSAPVKSEGDGDGMMTNENITAAESATAAITTVAGSLLSEVKPDEILSHESGPVLGGDGGDEVEYDEMPDVMSPPPPPLPMTTTTGPVMDVDEMKIQVSETQPAEALLYKPGSLQWDMAGVVEVFVRAALGHGAKSLTHAGRTLENYQSVFEYLRPFGNRAVLQLAKATEDAILKDGGRDAEYFAMVLRAVFAFWKEGFVKCHFVINQMTRLGILSVDSVQTFMLTRLSIKRLGHLCMFEIFDHLVREAERHRLTHERAMTAARRSLLGVAKSISEGGPSITDLRASQAANSEGMVRRLVTDHLVLLIRRIVALSEGFARIGKRKVQPEQLVELEDEPGSIAAPEAAASHTSSDKASSTTMTTSHLNDTNTTNTQIKEPELIGDEDVELMEMSKEEEESACRAVEEHMMGALLSYGRAFLRFVDVQEVSIQVAKYPKAQRVATIIATLSKLQSYTSFPNSSTKPTASSVVVEKLEDE